jgi:elongation factor P
MKVKLKHLTRENVVEKTFRSNEKIENAHVDRKTMQYLYQQDNEYIFMDNESYEQFPIAGDMLAGNELLMKEGINFDLMFYEGKAISIQMPTFINLKIIETEPGIKGDTVSGAMKPAKLETGLVIQVPLFINDGETIKVDTRDKSYNERA